jgi:hypothetical protein
VAEVSDLRQDRGVEVAVCGQKQAHRSAEVLGLRRGAYGSRRLVGGSEYCSAGRHLPRQRNRSGGCFCASSGRCDARSSVATGLTSMLCVWDSRGQCFTEWCML